MSALTLLGYIVVPFAFQILLAIGVAISCRKPADIVLPVQTAPSKAAWRGLRDFRVTRRAFEDAAQIQCSFALAPLDAIASPPFEPGQFPTLWLALDGVDPRMKALIPALQGWGVAEADIHHESFGPQTSAPSPLPAALGLALTIGFRRSGCTLDWRGQDANLLDFAERHLIAVDAGCRSGSCGTCETRVISGRVVYLTKPDLDVAPGHCLLCFGTPATALELDA